ncbi:hypothetical protein [Solimicrobium silvestre]|uniref:Uncharacterized protein n=1 Tax=Solimicrobium silvestre TaxID=2099400 RepID=A0A2S9GZE9_9BURK|nr:hypothetical protein [Solimicrobium silvestre]PRC93104.1 hypothetical protein S2091_2190 [Solimicrobium silvestre]
MQDDYGNSLPRSPSPDEWASLCKWVGSLEDGLAENMKVCRRTEDNTAEIIIVFDSVKGAFKVLGWIGQIAKPVAAIISLGLATWGVVLAVKAGISQK